MTNSEASFENMGTQIHSPSRLYGPGTLITVSKEILSTGALSLHLAFILNDEALAALWREFQDL